MLLYHYCSFEKFLSIIKSRTLWLTQIVKSNDTEEVVRTFRIIWDRIKGDIEKGISDLHHSSDIMSILNNQMELELQVATNGNETPYGVCLSVNRDLAQNWNEYGDKSRGIALGFSDELLTGIPHDLPHPSTDLNHAIGWNQVYYDRDDLAKQFIPIFIDMLKNDPTALGWLSVRTTLKHYSAFIKNPCFQDEREVRIVYYPFKEHDVHTTSEVSSLISEPFPHCTLPWLKSNGVCALKEIIIGTNCEHTNSEILDLLHKGNINYDINIVKSEYPYKISDNR